MSEKIRVLETESDFLNIRVAHDFKVLRSWAWWVIKHYDCDFRKLSEEAEREWKAFDEAIVGGFWDYKCSDLYAAWDYDQMGSIDLLSGCVLANGHHRALTLACLLLQKKVRYEPVKYRMAYSKALGHAHVYGCRPIFSEALVLKRRELKDFYANFSKELEASRARFCRDTSEVENLVAKMEADVAAAAVDMEADVFRPFGTV